jgi:hypothetical protein
MSVIETASVMGQMRFLRSNAPDGDRCVCCDGPHIFARWVEIPDRLDRYGERPMRPGEWIDDFTTRKADGRPVHEGKMVRITVEIIEPEADQNPKQGIEP